MSDFFMPKYVPLKYVNFTAMPTYLSIFVFSFFSGITILLGGLLANFFNHHLADSPIKSEITHTSLAFGGGVILAALSFVLVPTGMEELDVLPLVISFTVGAICFAWLDRYLAKRGGKMAMLLAMMMDFIPESIALGAVFAVDIKKATLLAVFIGIQNLPEAFNSFRELVLGSFTVKTTLLIFFLLSFSGVAGAYFGFFFLTDRPDFTAHLMTFASGGILYLLFHDIIPESKLDNSWLSSLGAALGFIVGILGEKLL